MFNLKEELAKLEHLTPYEKQYYERYGYPYHYDPTNKLYDPSKHKSAPHLGHQYEPGHETTLLKDLKVTKMNYPHEEFYEKSLKKLLKYSAPEEIYAHTEYFETHEKLKQRKISKLPKWKKSIAFAEKNATSIEDYFNKLENHFVATAKIQGKNWEKKVNLLEKKEKEPIRGWQKSKFSPKMQEKIMNAMESDAFRYTAQHITGLEHYLNTGNASEMRRRLKLSRKSKVVKDILAFVKTFI